MKLKAGVKIGGIRPEILYAIEVARELYALFNVELTITSIMEGAHDPHSKHYRGLAVDLRTHNLHPETIPGIVETLKINLGEEYYVERDLAEVDHIHIQFNGKI